MTVFCFEIKFVGFKSTWKKLVKKGFKIQAIKEYRNSFLRKNKDMPSLLEASVVIDAYGNKLKK
jgi:hypothetical protein